MAENSLSAQPPSLSVINQSAWILCIIFHLVFIGIAAWWTVDLLGPDGGGLGIFVAIITIAEAVWMTISLILVIRRQPKAFLFLSIAALFQVYGLASSGGQLLHPTDIWAFLSLVMAATTVLALVMYLAVKKRQVLPPPAITV